MPQYLTLTLCRGATREETRLTEAKSYLNFARASNFFGHFEDRKYKDYPSRIFTEDRAVDSFQNIIFSLTEFNHRYKNFPEELVVVSHEFKRARFEQLHFSAVKELMLPTSSKGIDVSWQGVPRFEGIDPKHMEARPDSERAIATKASEKKNGFDLWEKTPFGTSGLLLEKRRERNVWKANLNYELVYAGGMELVAALEAGAVLREIDWRMY